MASTTVMALACRVRRSKSDTAKPVSTDSANTTSRPKRDGARSQAKNGTTEYRTEYKPAGGPNDAQNASTVIPPYSHVTSPRSR